MNSNMHWSLRTSLEDAIGLVEDAFMEANQLSYCGVEQYDFLKLNRVLNYLESQRGLPGEVISK